MSDTELIFRVYRELLILNNNKKATWFKSGQRTWIDISPNEDLQMANKHTHKNTQHHWSSGKHKLNTWDTTSHPVGWLLSKNQKITSVGKDVDKSELLYTVGGSIKWYSGYRQQHGSSWKKLKIKLLHDPGIPLLGICPMEIKNNAENLKCWTQYVSKFGKLINGHRIGKGRFSFQSQSREMTSRAEPSGKPNLTYMWSLKIVKISYKKI